MKLVIKILLILLILKTSFGVVISRSNEKDVKYEIKILEKIAEDIIHKDVVKVYLIGYDKNRIKKFSTAFKLVKNIDDADIVIVSKEDKSIFNIRNKIVLATDFKLLKEIPECIGALYWKKGRPHIVFIKERLKDFKIKLSKDYGKFIIDEKELYSSW
jgi:hypothetical protein